MKLIPLFILCLFSSNVFSAGTPTFNSLTQSDVSLVSKEFASNFTHTILAPASSLGKIWGLEFGVMGGLTSTPEIDRISKTVSPSANISSMPTAGLIGGVTLPFGINAELNMIPQINTSSLYLKNISYALKWEVTSAIPTAPFNFAVRVHGNSGELGYSGVVNNATTGNQNVNATTSWKNTSSGYNLEISKKLLFIEPYFGYGRINTTTNITVAGSSNISIFTFSSASSYKAENSGSHLFAGLNLNLLFIKVGAEYAQVMGIKKTVAKVSFYF